jgi:predicted lipoprotein with Yx(FWY)xxD motif
MPGPFRNSRNKRVSDRTSHGRSRDVAEVAELVLANHVECNSINVASTTGFAQVPSMTTAQKNALTAANGMLVYDTTLNKMHGYINGAWASLT